ncbi:unnamed protein product [Rotaria sordida]|uniref:EF-hand domain-containing protein n=2 Tax=Rotaria sordida TaxID=392033 RepID=A0A815UYR4_9BILA|nr:unnamed protein product [Rotaria sordida]CAF1522789.1 unnamed protein product [Rotaria sordida]
MPKKGRTNMNLTPNGEIREWHTDFLRQYPSDTLDKKTFIDYYQKLHLHDEADITEIFDRININDDSTIDFNELLLLIPIRKKLGNLEQRLTFLFNLWDDSERWTNLSKRTNLFNISYDISDDKKLSKQEFVNGCINDPVICGLLVRCC